MADCGSGKKGSDPVPDEGITGQWPSFATGTYAVTKRSQTCDSSWNPPITYSVVICTDGPAFDVQFDGQEVTSELTSESGRIGDSTDVTIVGNITRASCQGIFVYHIWGHLHPSGWKFHATTALFFPYGPCTGTCTYEELIFVRTGDPPNPCGETTSCNRTSIGSAERKNPDAVIVPPDRR